MKYLTEWQHCLERTRVSASQGENLGLIRIEKKTSTAIKKCLVYENGESKFGITLDKLQNLAMIWLLFAIPFLTYGVGKLDTYQEVKTVLYMSKGMTGQMYDENGTQIQCLGSVNGLGNVVFDCNNGTAWMGGKIQTLNVSFNKSG